MSGQRSCDSAIALRLFATIHWLRAVMKTSTHQPSRFSTLLSASLHQRGCIERSRQRPRIYTILLTSQKWCHSHSVLASAHSIQHSCIRRFASAPLHSLLCIRTFASEDLLQRFCISAFASTPFSQHAVISSIAPASLQLRPPVRFLCQGFLSAPTRQLVRTQLCVSQSCHLGGQKIK